MSFIKHLKTNKDFRSSLLTLLLALSLLISVVMAAFQVNAWFVNTETVKTPALLTNFEYAIEYCIDVENDIWRQIETNNSIPVIITENAITLDTGLIGNNATVSETFPIRITYKGSSAAYLRVSLSGSFQNMDTSTYLPQTEAFWEINSSDWVKNGDYWYYSQKLGDSHDQNKLVGQYKNSQVLTTINVTPDLSKIAESISPHQDYSGKLYLHVDAVQPDRVKAFWDLDELPF